MEARASRRARDRARGVRDAARRAPCIVTLTPNAGKERAPPMQHLVPEMIRGLRAIVSRRQLARDVPRDTGASDERSYEQPQGRDNGEPSSKLRWQVMRACPECRKLYSNDTTECPEHRRALVPLEDLPDEDPELQPGSMVGEYRVDHKLGSGTFGDVYAGEQPLIGKKVAIKVLHRRFTSNRGVVGRFVAEARAVNKIRHKNIIDIFSFGVLGEEQPYFVMERLEGLTLGELLDREKRLTPEAAVPILRGIADGLDAAHEAGVTHRDLKPDNIFLVQEKDGTYSAKLLDFGVAKLVTDELAHKTATGAAIGTPSYMAPEQCRARPIDHRADIYALGVVVHEMLTGRRLFHADSAMEVLFKHVSEPPPPMSEVYPHLPKELDAPVLAMLAKSPNDRPSSAGAAVSALIERITGAWASERAADPTSFERSLLRREAATMADAPQAVEAVTGVDSAAPTAQSPRDATAQTSAAVVISVDDATATDPEAASARTMMAPSSPASGTLLAGAPPVEAMTARTPPARPEPTEIDAPARRPEPPAHAAPSRQRTWPLVIGGAAVLAAAIVALRPAGNTTPTTPSAAAGAESARPLPSKVTIRLAVTPADADVIVDGMRAGAASDPLVLPRTDQGRAIRLEKEGYEPQALVIVPDRDHDLPPIALRPMQAPAIPPSATAPAKAPPKPAYHDDLERPPELKRFK
jgi:serine/threonine-protein kinase